MGGELEVESTLGQGSRFFFTLPLVLLPDGRGRPIPDDEVAGRRSMRGWRRARTSSALVADDSTVNRRILAGLLESAGFHVITATGGREAIDADAEHHPDIVFMDLRMPDLDGFEATRQLAASPATAAIPVVAVTASAFGDTRTAAREAGCVDYLPKPVRAETLFAILQTQLGVQFVTRRAAGCARRLGPDSSDRRNRRSPPASVTQSTLGDIADLERLAQQLMAGDTGDAALGAAHRPARGRLRFRRPARRWPSRWHATADGAP